MRDRFVRSSMVTVRPLKPSQGDVFGDASIVTSDNRGQSFMIKAQVTFNAGRVSDDAKPGRNSSYSVACLIRKRDVPSGAPPNWTPDSNDMFIVDEGSRSLFVVDVQPAFPARISVRRRMGGFDGWRILLSDRQPTIGPAATYE